MRRYDYASKPEFDKDESSKRVCLNCRREFKSEHKCNRLCVKCTEYAGKNGSSME